MWFRAGPARLTRKFSGWLPPKRRAAHSEPARAARLRNTRKKSAPLRGSLHAKACVLTLASSASLHRHRRAQLLAQNPAHNLIERFACFFQHKRVRLFRPSQLETRRQRRNPYLAHRRIRADHETCFVRVIEQNFDLAASALHFESAVVAHFQKPLLEA